MTGLWQNLRGSPNVLFATSEVAPLIKTGGLADVSFALPNALLRHGIGVTIVLPAYRAVLERVAPRRDIARARVARWDIEVWLAELAPSLNVLLIAQPQLFDRPGSPYQDHTGLDWPDNAERFGCFCHAVAWLASGEAGLERPDIVHLNDWPTGPTAALLTDRQERPRIVFTIHNLEYQGVFDASTLAGAAIPPRLFTVDGLEYYGKVSFMKGGLTFADALTTVSESYAAEIQTAEGGQGLDGLLRYRSDALTGILNGIDDEEWNPATDPRIAARYQSATLETKRLNTQALRSETGLERSSVPLFGVVSRLVSQKGMDLVLEIVDRLAVLPAQLVVLGSGEALLEDDFTAAAARHPGRVAFRRGFDERLAHLIEAGADVFLMPSRFEPCGLNQMYSMRYGTVPVAHRTGGLADTITPVKEADGTGFLFDAPTADALWAAIEEAVAVYRDPPRWRAVQRTGMNRDFSWARSAETYASLYRRLIE